MSKIIKRSEPILTEGEKKLINALSFPMLKDLSPSAKDAANIMLIANVYANVNEKNPEPAVEAKMLSDLRELMDTEFKAMRVNEIRIALDWGSDNWDGHGVSSKLIKSWIRSWRRTKKLELQKSIALKSKSEVKEVPELTKKQKIYSINHEFERYRNRKPIRAKIYPYMEEFGMVVTPIMKYMAIDIAIPKLKLEAKDFDKSTALDLKMRKDANEMLEHHSKMRIKELQNCDKTKPIPIVVSEAQKIIIRNFFDMCMNECMSLGELLKA